MREGGREGRECEREGRREGGSERKGGRGREGGRRVNEENVKIWKANYFPFLPSPKNKSTISFL